MGTIMGNAPGGSIVAAELFIQGATRASRCYSTPASQSCYQAIP